MFGWMLAYLCRSSVSCLGRVREASTHPQCAFKCSFATMGGNDREVFKNPVTDPGKQSKRGRLTLERDADGKLHTVPISLGWRGGRGACKDWQKASGVFG